MKKHLLLLLFISLNSFGQTYQEVSDLIDKNLASGQKITALKHREVEHALLNLIQQSASQSGDIKRIKCDLAYYTANFQTNGLGKNLRAGWAVCNGENGTDNLAGRVGIGFGAGYSAFGGTGGTKDAVIVAHNHTASLGANIDFGSAITKPIRLAPVATGDGNIIPISVDSVGESGVDKNMQPYIIQLYIMKL